MRWRLDNLQADTTYECLVQARNKYGWSQPSKMFNFQTSLHTMHSAATQGLILSSGAEVRYHCSWLVMIMVWSLVTRHF